MRVQILVTIVAVAVGFALPASAADRPSDPLEMTLLKSIMRKPLSLKYGTF